VSLTDGLERTAPSQSLLSGQQLAVLDVLGVAREPRDARPESANAALGALRASRGTQLLWPRAAEHSGEARRATIDCGDRAATIFAQVSGDERASLLLESLGGTWTRVAKLTDEHAVQVGSIWRERSGSVFVPFDPDEVCHRYWSERYAEALRPRARRGLHAAAIRSYYAARGLLPRGVQIALRRSYARRQARAPFPRWPIETSLHDFYAVFAAMLVDVAGEAVPRIASWPGQSTWALVLTHDVETADGAAALDPVLTIERELGLRSSWNFVPLRYEVDPETVRRLGAEGFEVGVHGLYHDGRDLESLARLNERLPGMREAAERWSAVGFRAPATQRGWELMPRLGFAYDSSYPDTDPFEPQAGGCCTWLPFFNGEMVELPLTMAQDHTLFTILRRDDESTWIAKADFLREQGGMALIDTHPDYLLDQRILAAYRALLERFAQDGTAWHALPREVDAWWRRRAASTIERDGSGWRVTGPAAEEARIELLEDSQWR
jgi:hypothetical protein